MTRLSRRTLLGAGLGAGAAWALAGCATPGTTSVNAQPTIPPAPSGETVHLTYWAWLTDLQNVANVWNEQNPHIQVEVSWIPGGNDGGYQQLYSSLAAGGGPDLAQVEMRAVPEFMLVNGLVDLSRYGADEHEGLFDPTMWDQVRFDDSVYAIPQDSGPMGMYYRPDLFEEAGAEVPTTWEEWAEAARALKETGIYLDAFPLADGSVFTGHAMQAGAAWFSAEEDHWVINMADEATLEVARFWDAAIDEGLVTTQHEPFSPGWFAAAGNDQIASLSSASWGDALLEGVSGAEGKWRVAPMPQRPGGYASATMGGSTSAVMANSQHPAEALEFALWLNSTTEGIDGMIEHSGIGWSVNPEHIGTAREQPSEFFGGQQYNTEVFEPAAEGQNPDWQWWPIVQQTFSILEDEFRQKAQGVSLVDAVVEAEEATVNVMTNKGLTVRRAER